MIVVGVTVNRYYSGYGHHPVEDIVGVDIDVVDIFVRVDTDD